MLAEPVQARPAVRRCAVDVSRSAAAVHAGAAQAWLQRAAAGGDRAVDRLDELTPLPPQGTT